MSHKMIVFDNEPHDGSVWDCQGPLGRVLERLARIQPKGPEIYDRGCVYAITYKGGLVKVGSSYDPLGRIRTHARNVHLYGGRKISLVAVTRRIRRHRETERDVHRRLSHCQVDKTEHFRTTIEEVAERLWDSFWDDEEMAVAEGFPSFGAWCDFQDVQNRADSRDLIESLYAIGRAVQGLNPKPRLDQ